MLFLTKKLGVGILTTAEKKGLLREAHVKLAAAQMMQLNKVGEVLGKLPGVSAMTDVTGFGLLGHLAEMAEGSGLSAEVDFENIQTIIDDLEFYIDNKSIPGGTHRNWDSYGEKIGPITDYQKAILADPQTSGGLLIAVAPSSVDEVKNILRQAGLANMLSPIGTITLKKQQVVSVK